MDSCERTQFKVIKQMSTVSALDFTNKTLHTKLHFARLQIVHALGELRTHSSYIVDTGHKDGAELHTVCTNGVIVIANLWRAEIITYLIARPGQIKRYGINDNELIHLCRTHVYQGLHDVRNT